jgi:hypothetical protein
MALWIRMLRFLCADAQCGLARARKPIYVIGV